MPRGSGGATASAEHVVRFARDAGPIPWDREALAGCRLDPEVAHILQGLGLWGRSSGSLRPRKRGAEPQWAAADAGDRPMAVGDDSAHRTHSRMTGTDSVT